MFFVRVYEYDSYSCLFARGGRSVYNREELAGCLHWSLVSLFLLLSLIISIAFRLLIILNCLQTPLLTLLPSGSSPIAFRHISIAFRLFSYCLQAHLYSLQAHHLLSSDSSIAFRLVSSFRLISYTAFRLRYCKRIRLFSCSNTVRNTGVEPPPRT